MYISIIACKSDNVEVQSDQEHNYLDMRSSSNNVNKTMRQE